ncbi:MAG: zinc-binding alcohol dehydrogenase family protein [Ktedonobacteraceae bacterium]
MRAISLTTPEQLRLIEAQEPPPPGPGEALIRIHRVGVCGTDYHAFRGKQPFFTYPRILGHELGVEVVMVGEEVYNVAAGMRCAVRPYLECGFCPPCRRGKPNCCANIQVFGVHVDGGMREFALIPASHLHPSARLTYDQLALVEPLAIGAHAVARAQLPAGERVLVVGAGPIGLAVTQFAVLAGVQVMVMDISEPRLAFVQRHWPSVTVINGQVSGLAALQEVTGDDLPVAVFDATGSPSSMQSAFSYVGFGGRLIFVGLFPGYVTFHDPLFHSHEMTLLSSRNSLAVDFSAIITVIERGQMNLTPWITHRTTLETLSEVFPQWIDPHSGIIKGVISI